GILSRLPDFGNGLDRAGMVFAAGAFVVRSVRRIGADHQKVVAGLETLMACARRQDSDVFSLDRQRATALAAELDLGRSASDAKNLMNARVVMHVVVDAVSPGSLPAVAREKVLEDCGGIEFGRQFHGAAIDDQRPTRMIGCDAVVLKKEFVGLARAYEAVEIITRGPLPAGDFLDDLLPALEDRHHAPPGGASIG